VDFFAIHKKTQPQINQQQTSHAEVEYLELSQEKYISKVSA
jgi:hypothetical protein